MKNEECMLLDCLKSLCLKFVCFSNNYIFVCHYIYMYHDKSNIFTPVFKCQFKHCNVLSTLDVFRCLL